MHARLGTLFALVLVMGTQRPYHNDEQEAAWLAVESTLEASTQATFALRNCGECSDDEYARLLSAANRADAEFAGAWKRYHAI